MEVMIAAKNLVKAFGEFKAVDGLNIEIRKGECFGLLGPNGAGKSTFINMTYGAALRTSGELQVLKHDPQTQSREIKKRLGVVTQDNALDESLSVRENMLIYAGFMGVEKTKQPERVDTLLKYMNLEHKADAPIQTLSGGMKRRLVFVRALLGQPSIVILDEPTTGLDPAVRHLLWGKVKELREQGTTILLTTHYMHEAEILCDRVAIMNKGKVLDVATPRELIQKHSPGFVAIYAQESKIEERLQHLVKTHSAEMTADSSSIHIRAQDFDSLLQLTKTFATESGGIQALQMRPANLEDVFLRLTGKELSAND